MAKGLEAFEAFKGEVEGREALKGRLQRLRRVRTKTSGEDEGFEGFEE